MVFCWSFIYEHWVRDESLLLFTIFIFEACRDLSHNNFSGHIPYLMDTTVNTSGPLSYVWVLFRLTQWYLAGSRKSWMLSGIFHTDVVDNVMHRDVSSNSFSGPLPNMNGHKTMQFLWVHSAKLEHSIAQLVVWLSRLPPADRSLHDLMWLTHVVCIAAM